MKFNLGILEKYYIKTLKTTLEDNPAIRITFKENINGELLKPAFLQAVERFPLFGSVLKYEKDYTFQTLEDFVNIYNVEFNDRPKTFGSTSDGLLYQLTYFENELLFEWSTIITDEKGALLFLGIFLEAYFGIELPPVHYPLPLELGIEKFMDKKEVSIKKYKELSGFSKKDLPYNKLDNNTHVHILKAKKENVINSIKEINPIYKEEIDVTSIIVPLFSKSLKKHINEDAKIKNVKSNVRLDLRNLGEIHSYRNCLISNHITYVDRYDNMPLNHLHTIYKTFISNAEEEDNIKYTCAINYKRLNKIVNIKPQFLSKMLINSIKHKDSNYTFTYLDKIPFSKEVLDMLESVHINSFPTYGECSVNVYEQNEYIYINISENYLDKEIINTFISVCNEHNIIVEEIDNYLFEQRNVILEK